MTPLRKLAALLQRLVDKIDPHEGRYRMLFERSPLPMWVVDIATRRFLAVNDAALRLYEYSREEFLAMTAHDIRHPEDGEAFSGFLGHIGDVHHGAFRHVKKTGEALDIDGNGNALARPLRTPPGQWPGTETLTRCPRARPRPPGCAM